METTAAQDPWASPRRVAGWAAECGISTEIPTDAFVLLAAQIDRYKAHPWTANDIADMKKIGLQQRDDRQARHKAARLLREEARPWRNIPSMAEHLRRWDEAIAVLRMPRGALDNPYNWLNFSESGNDMRPWTYMASEISGWLVQILRGYCQPEPTFGESSPVVRFAHKALAFIGVNEGPKPKTLGNKLRETLTPLLEDWPDAR
jgi:hypothetical protein